MSEKTTKRPGLATPLSRLPTRGEEVVEAVVKSAENYLRENPWLAVAGAALASRALDALNTSPIRKQTSRAAVRDWVDQAYELLPTKKQFQSAAKSAGIPTTVGQLKAKLEE